MHRNSGLLLLLTILPALAQQAKFEVADVHVSPTARGFAQNFGGVLRAGKYVNRDATMLNLISAAYGVSEDGIAGGPGWVSSDVFDVVAKVPEGTKMAAANQMLQALLAERFHLVVKNENAPQPRYVLTVGKGSKLKPADGSANPGCRPKQQPGGPGPGTASNPASIPNIQVVCQNLTAQGIADNLRQMAGGYFDHDVVDQTNLEGSFDFDLEWTGRGVLSSKGADGISAFDAVDKQLGLKVELKNIPMPALVIQSVNRKPTPNPSNISAALNLAQARFEAATIKPADPDAQPFVGLLYTGGSQMRAGGTLRQMIAMALQISPNVAGDMLVGIPKAADTQRWDITAKVPSTGEGAPNIVKGQPQPPPLSVGLEMLRGLLVESFELKNHTDNREVTVYALTAGSGKPKMTQAAESERSGCAPAPDAPKPVKTIGVMIGCKNLSMAELAQTLEQFAGAYIDHPIVDATGLQGGWDLVMGWTPKGQLQPVPNPNAAVGAAGEASDPNGMSVFEAVEKELGLKLVKTKKSIPVVVVDHVAEKPVQ
jgi:uncharacterized protein (TIGR03435 family)